MDSIKDTIASVIQALQAKNTCPDKNDPRALLKKALTKKELGHIKFNYLHKGILSLNVDSSSWLYHLSLKKEGLLAEFKKQNNIVKDIRFRIGEVK